MRDAVVAEVRKLDRKISSMHECPRGLGRYENRDRFSDGYGTYLAGHALQIVAGHYLQSMPVERDEWESDPWGEWLRRYSLPNVRLWASDVTDPYPYDLPTLALDLGDPKKKTSAQDRVVLASICDLPPNTVRKGDSLLLAAQWETANETTIHVSSAMINASEVDRFAAALALIDPTFQYLPKSRDFSRGFDADPLEQLLVHPLEETEHTEARIDEGDPYGTSTALDRARPAEWLQRMLVTTDENEEGHGLNRHGSNVLELEYWGARFGRGRHERSESGYRVSCPKMLLSELLKSQELALVVLVDVHRYLKGSRHRESTLSRRSAVVVVDHEGRARPIQRISGKLRAAWKTLDRSDRTDLTTVYACLRNVA